MSWRYATKRFDPARRIPDGLWKVLEDVLVLSPSSFGLQPWKFFVVKDPALRARLRPAAWNQPQITDASHLVVFAVKKDLSAADVRRFIARTAQVRGVPAASLADYQGRMEGFVAKPPMDINMWATKQVYIALGFLLSAAASLGVDACPMEGFDPKKVTEILGLEPKGFGAVVMATLGYRSGDDKYAEATKVRYPKSEVLETI
jgi:nitroreductase